MSSLQRCSILVLILVVAGCGYGKQAQIDSYAASEKKQMPKVMFADVNMVDIESAPSEVIYYCDSRGMNTSQLDRERDRLLKKAGTYVNRNKVALKRMIDNRIKMTFVVKEATGEELFRVSINPWEY